MGWFSKLFEGQVADYGPGPIETKAQVQERELREKNERVKKFDEQIRLLNIKIIKYKKELESNPPSKFEFVVEKVVGEQIYQVKQHHIYLYKVERFLLESDFESNEMDLTRFVGWELSNVFVGPHNGRFSTLREAEQCCDELTNRPDYTWYFDTNERKLKQDKE